MRSPSCRRALVATLLVALAVLCMGATALAAPTVTGPATWSAYTPADGGSVGALRPPIAVTATDTKGLLGSPYVSLKVDGTLQSAAWTRVSPNTLSAAFTPRANLANGTHTVYASVRNNSGTYSTTTWSFTVSNAPKPSSPAPVPGSTVSTDSPVITVAVGGATTGLTSTVVVDGTSVPATFDSGAGVLSAPTSHLANDASHDVTVTVTNSSGQSDHLSWSFSVQVYASMPSGAQDCVTCHPGFPDAHPMTNCLACHGPGSPVGEGWNTPDYAQHSASYVARTPTSCIDCHSAGYSTVPAMHPFTPAATYHDSTTACSPCHVRNLTTEHYRYGLTCLSCHGSVDPLVQTAIATGSTACESCHPGAASHTAIHNVTLDASCTGSGCHATGTDTTLTDIHINSGTTLTCDTCHKSTDTNVVAAIAGGVKACDACHGTTNHEAQHATTVVASCAGSGCHTGTSLTAIHINSDGKYSCATCHGSSDPKVAAAIAGKTTDCTACHDATGHTAAHDTTVNPSCTGLGCHTGTNLTAIHINSDGKYSCATCHSSTDPKVTAAIASNNKDCVACHDATSVHGDVTAIHAASVSPGTITVFDGGTSHAYNESGPVSVTADCTLCHASTNLVSIHANDCSACHNGTSAPRNSFTTWNKTCSQGSCHPSYHDNASPAHDDEYAYGCDCHDYNNIPFSTTPISASAEYCGGCHATGADTTPPTSSSDAVLNYVGPATITITATDDRVVYNTYYRLDGGATSTVNAGVVTVPAPASGTQGHVLEFWARDLAGNDEAPHNTAVFSVSPDTQPPVTSSDATATYSGPVTIKLTPTDNATSLGVKTTYYQFDSGAVQTGTTATLPQPSGGLETHAIHFWSEDWSGNVESAHTATFTVSADTVAPTTTSDLLPSPKYYPGGRINMNFYPTDPSPSSGVAGVHVDCTNPNTWWGDFHEASYNAATGTWQLAMWSWTSGTYPVTYYARDKASNVESVKTTTILIDANAPVTTVPISYGQNFVGPQTFTLSPSDTGGSGLAGTWYSLDGGAYVSGTSVSVGAPPTGSASHTLAWYSTDGAGNRGTGSLMFYVQAVSDTTPPTGTMSVNNTAAWTSSTSASVNSTVTDSGSGVSQMRIDPGTGTYGGWIAYAASSPITLPSGNGTKTVNVQYRDAQGNVLTLTDTIGLDATAPTGSMSVNNGATQVATVTASVNSTVTDTLSGMSQMRIDPGSGTYGSWIAYAATSQITLPTGDGVKTVNVQYRDAAGNALTLTDTITLNTTPDTTPPTTTSSFNPAAGAVFKTAQAVTLTATDNLAGVKTTYYEIDSGAWMSGTSFTVTGDGLHTFSYYSVDNANNTETTHTCNQFRIDTVAPVTTNSAVQGQTYTGSQTFSLSASDTNGSGVASTWYQLDGGALTAGTTVAVAAPGSGSAAHTITWYSVDVAGNQEVTHAVSFTVAAPAGTTTLRATLTSSSWHAYAHFVFYDENGTVIGDSGWTTDEHTSSYSMVVPAGHSYTMFVEFEVADYDGGGTGSDSRVVTAAEAAPGATVSWVSYY